MKEVLTFPIVRAMFKTARFSTGRLRRRQSVPITVRPMRADVAIARTIARNTAPAPEQVARALTWGADEKVLFWFSPQQDGSLRADAVSRRGALATMLCWSRSRRRWCRTP
jgi:hypothetical protein